MQLFDIRTLVSASLMVMAVQVSVGESLRADMVWRSTESGEERCALDVLVYAEMPELVQYWEFVDRMLQEGSCAVPAGKERTVRVAKSSEEEKRRLIASWVRRGYSAELTTLSGTKLLVHGLSLDFQAPRGILVMCGYGACPQGQKAINIGKGAAVETIEFETLDTITIEDDAQVLLTLRDGNKVTGPLKYHYAADTQLVPFLSGSRILETRISTGSSST